MIQTSLISIGAVGVAGDKRQQILETAYRLFRADGYHAVGIDRIIAEAGVAKMTMYRHFRAKDDLIAAVLRWRAGRFEAQLDRMLAPIPEARARIEAIVGWYGRWFARPDFHGCAFAHAVAEFGGAGHPVFEAAFAQKQAFQDRLRVILTSDTEERQAARTAAMLAMLFEGATLRAQMGRAEEAAEGLRAGARALLARPGAAA